jgi:hypothetical protein
MKPLRHPIQAFSRNEPRAQHFLVVLVRDRQRHGRGGRAGVQEGVSTIETRHLFSGLAGSVAEAPEHDCKRANPGASAA